MSKFRQIDRRAWRQYMRVRSRIMAAKPKCAICGIEDAVETHHLVPLARGGGNGPDNLVPLCRLCHEHEHAAKKNVKRDEKLGEQEELKWGRRDA